MFVLAFAQPIYATELTCPAGIGAIAGQKPTFVKAFKDGTRVILCGDAGPGANGLAGEFDVYSVDTSGKLSASLFQVTSLETYKVYSNGDILNFDELMDGANGIPLFSRKLKCVKGDCTFSKESCIVKPPRVASQKQVLKQLQDYLSHKAATYPSQELAYLAFSCDADARKFFADPPKEFDQRLGVADQEDFGRLKAQVNRVVVAKCKYH